VCDLENELREDINACLDQHSERAIAVLRANPEVPQRSTEEWRTIFNTLRAESEGPLIELILEHCGKFHTLVDVEAERILEAKNLDTYGLE
jgi:hypothetical protein